MPKAKAKKRGTNDYIQLDGLTVKNALNELVLDIKKDHVKRAKCKDPRHCVIAQAVDDSPLGDAADDIVVGTRCTKIRVGTTILRYTTPARLGRAVREFDESDEWTLPLGIYKLQPYDGGKTRWSERKVRETKGVQSTFNNGKPARRTPTRKTESVSSMRRRLREAA